MIGVFDSGFGGLTVLKPIMDLLPEYDYVYLGDNARAPYGNHSEKTIREYTEQAINHLFGQGVKLIIIACNTASTNALSWLQKEYLDGENETERKILGVTIPTAEYVVKVSKTKRIGLVGTKATINSKKYEAEVAKLSKDIKLYSKACPLLVPLIEENWHHRPEAISILKKYLRPLKHSNIDTLILGCTHYPLMYKYFEKHMGKNVTIVQSGVITANSLKDYLIRHPEIESKITKNKKRKFQTTDCPVSMKNFIEKYFGIMISRPEKVKIGKK